MISPLRNQISYLAESSTVSQNKRNTSPTRQDL